MSPSPEVGPEVGPDAGAERSARVVLAAVADPGDDQLGLAVERSGAHSVVRELVDGTSALSRAAGYRMRLSALDADPAHAAQTVVQRLEDTGGRVVVPGDREWPTQLDDLGPRLPFALFVRGENLRLAAVRSVAVVGARAASQYGTAVATDLAADLADRGWSVVSGGAYGIDAAAHRGALAAAGLTVAVLACGVDVAYPPGHAALFDRIAAEGVLVSELPPGAHPSRVRFLTRNRLIAALSRATLVVEAAHRSGSLNTAALARTLGRPVLAVPGPVTSPMSAGVHHLLREHQESTRLVTAADEVVEELGPLGVFAPEPKRPTRPWDGLDPSDLAVFEALPAGRPVGLAALALAVGRPAAEVVPTLGRLRMLGLAVEHEGGWRVAPQLPPPGPAA